MTSPTPLLYDTWYHIYNRGVNGEDIFIQERNYDLFLKLFEKHLSPVVDLFAYCLLRNHFHISVRVKSEEEILATRKTLKVSTPGWKQDVPGLGSFASRDKSSQRKPLGFRYISDQFSNFFNAYATRSASIKPTGGQVAYSSIRLGVCPLPQIANFGM